MQFFENCRFEADLGSNSDFRMGFIKMIENSEFLSKEFRDQLKASQLQKNRNCFQFYSSRLKIP